MFDQPQQENNVSNTPSPQVSSPKEIYVMPEKFLGGYEAAKISKPASESVVSSQEVTFRPDIPQQTAAPSTALGAGKKRWPIFAAIAIVVIIVIAGAGFLLNRNINSNKPATNTAQQQVNTNIPESPIVNEAKPANINTPVSIINQNTNQNIEATTSIKTLGGEVIGTTTTATTTPVAPSPSSSDLDEDKLTDKEEELYNTYPKVADSDGDGYLDGNEVLNLYNPKMGGGSRLDMSGLVNPYINSIYHYSVLYSSSWLARPKDGTNFKEVMFMSTTGEFIKVEALENVNNLSLFDWYKGQTTTFDETKIQQKTEKDFAMISDKDGLNWYLQSTLPGGDKRVYLISYNTTSNQQQTFNTTFLMMVKSFKF